MENSLPETKYLALVCAEIIKSLNKSEIAGGPGLGIRALSLSEQTAANVPMHIETDPTDFEAEYKQPFSPSILKKKKKKNRKFLSPLANVTEIVS